MDFDESRFVVNNNKIYYTPDKDMNLRGLRIHRNGLLMGEIKTKRFEPSQALASSLTKDKYDNYVDLKLEEAAMLVGMCKNPSLYNPRRRPENALNRRNTVLNQLCKYDYITEQVCDSLKALPIELKYQSVDHKQGAAPYFREYLRQILTAKEPKRSHYSEWNQLQYEIDKRQWEENPLTSY